MADQDQEKTWQREAALVTSGVGALGSVAVVLKAFGVSIPALAVIAALPPAVWPPIITFAGAVWFYMRSKDKKKQAAANTPTAKEGDQNGSPNKLKSIGESVKTAAAKDEEEPLLPEETTE